MCALVAGVDLGGTHMQIGVVDQDGRIVGRTRGLTPVASGPAGVIDAVVSRIDEACAAAGARLEDLRAVCVGVPAPVDATFRIALNAVNLNWREEPAAALIEQAIERRTGKPVATHVSLDNDVNVAAWGEFALGAGRGAVNMLGVWVGTGVGGGLVLGGRLHHGSFGTAGEFGQTWLFPGCGPAHVRVEHHGSRTFIVDDIRRLIRANAQSSLRDMVGGDVSTLTIAHVAQAIASGDRLAVEVTRHAARVVGIAAANATTLLSLDTVVLGGGVTEAVGAVYVQWVREAFDEAVFPERCRNCAILPTSLKDDAGIVGAGALAWARSEQTS